MKQFAPGLVAGLAVLCVNQPSSAIAQVNFDWVVVGDPGNAADPINPNPVNQRGAVAYEYRIMKTEVTNAQYAEFLNHKATFAGGGGGNDTRGLYYPAMGVNGSNPPNILRTGAGTVSDGYVYTVAPGRENYPIGYVDWFSAVRFVNWMQNGQGDADTETGAYRLQGPPFPIDITQIAREPNATYGLPSYDEWYKSAFYDPDKAGGPGYWRYTTRSDQQPTELQVNYRTAHTNNEAPRPVGSYPLSPSAYGTLDQGGNVEEWIDKFLIPQQGGTKHGTSLGGAYWSTVEDIRSGGGNLSQADSEMSSTGFRIVNLVRSVIGDATWDDVVDGADYTRWADHFLQTGQTYSTGDFNGDGIVDGIDYTIWADNFAPPQLTVSAVPEPSTLALAGIGALALAVTAARRRTA